MKLLYVVAASAMITGGAYAAEDKPMQDGMMHGNMMNGDMMNGDMMKTCQQHMKDGKMMDSMPKDMMSQCQEMMKNGNMMQGGVMGGEGMDTRPDAAKHDTTKAGDKIDHHQ